MLFSPPLSSAPGKSFRGKGKPCVLAIPLWFAQESPTPLRFAQESPTQLANAVRFVDTTERTDGPVDRSRRLTCILQKSQRLS